jgi:dTDP-4-amino-4,6-dideoxygalactose transaminase
LREADLKVPQIDLVRQYRLLKNEIDRSVLDVLDSGQFILGPWVRDLEEKVADLTGAGQGIGVASGTDALELALIACGVGAGDEVITSPFSFVSVAEVAIKLGAKPVFTDIDKLTFNMDAARLEDLITPKTKAIVPVHLYGQSTDMDPFMEIAARHSIHVIEDAAQAIGAKYKGRPVCSIAPLACLSFYPTKNLGCYGDGGMVLANDSDLGKKVEALRKHGQIDKYRYNLIGLNSRLDSVQAAILVVKLARLDAWNERRREVASLYNQGLADLRVEVPFVADFAHHVYHQYTIKTAKRDGLRDFLAAKGIGTAIHYPLGLHLQDAYLPLGYKQGDLPNCDEVSRQVLSLPMFPEIEDAEVDYVCSMIGEFFKHA